jgi:phosphate transport system permease protein
VAWATTMSARGARPLVADHVAACLGDSALLTRGGFKSRSGRLVRALEHGDVPFRLLVMLMSGLVLLVVAAIGYELWRNSSLSRDQFGLAFVFGTNWDPVAQDFGALPFWYGTLVTSAVALILAVPVSLGIAIFLAELAPDWLRSPLGFLVELLSAVPSVVYGLWGLFVLVPTVIKPGAQLLAGSLGFLPIFQGPVLGPSRLAASAILAIMITPTISAVSRDVFRAIPRAQREAALALGATRWEMIWQILVPYGLSGILGAVILGLGRALGETMAVTMIIGNNLDLSASLLHPGYTMASLIANEFSEASNPLYLNALVEIGLLLFGLTLLLNVFARYLVWRTARQTPAEGRG